MTRAQIRARAAARRGARFLDKTLGRGWRRKIRRRELDLGATHYIPGSCGCVLAQLNYRANKGGRAGSYSAGARSLGLVTDDYDYSRAADLGFDLTGDEFTHGDLTEAWLAVLREPAS